MEQSAGFIMFLQGGIAPIALISGVGLILLTLNNRLGRTVDRVRMLVQKLDANETPKRDIMLRELEILYKRSKILRSSIGSIAFSILTSSLIVVVLLVMNITSINLAILGKALFALSITGIVASAIFLFIDIVLTLKALRYEVRQYIK